MNKNSTDDLAEFVTERAEYYIMQETEGLAESLPTPRGWIVKRFDKESGLIERVPGGPFDEEMDAYVLATHAMADEEYIGRWSRARERLVAQLQMIDDPTKNLRGGQSRDMLVAKIAEIDELISSKVRGVPI